MAPFGDRGCDGPTSDPVGEMHNQLNRLSLRCGDPRGSPTCWNLRLEAIHEMPGAFVIAICCGRQNGMAVAGLEKTDAVAHPTQKTRLPSRFCSLTDTMMERVSILCAIVDAHAVHPIDGLI